MDWWAKIHPMLGSVLVMIALAGGLALALRMDWLALDAPPIALTMTIKPARQEGSALMMPVQLVLNNPSHKIQSLPPQNACKIFRWFVLDESGSFVQSAPVKNDCDPAMIERALRPEKEVIEKITLKLEAKRFQRGRPYYLIVRFWGLDQRASFTP